MKTGVRIEGAKNMILNIPQLAGCVKWIQVEVPFFVLFYAIIAVVTFILLFCLKNEHNERIYALDDVVVFSLSWVFSLFLILLGLNDDCNDLKKQKDLERKQTRSRMRRGEP
jgi:hypothetical protein